jgi:hypothetical protein
MMGAQAPPELLGIHTNMAAAVPPEIDKAAFTGALPPPDLSAEEKDAYDKLTVYKHGLGTPTRWRTSHRHCMGSRVHRSVSPPE